MDTWNWSYVSYFSCWWLFHIEGISSHKLDVFQDYCNFCRKHNIYFMRPYALKLYFPQIGGDSLLTVNGVLVFLACEALKIVFRPGEKQAVFFMIGNIRIYSFIFRNMPSSVCCEQSQSSFWQFPQNWQISHICCTYGPMLQY